MMWPGPNLGKGTWPGPNPAPWGEVCGPAQILKQEEEGLPKSLGGEWGRGEGNAAQLHLALQGLQFGNLAAG